MRELSRLRGRKKWEYIWDYYKLWIIGILCILLFSVFCVRRYTVARKGYWIFITFVNTRAEAGNGSMLWKGFVDYAGYDPAEKTVAFQADSYFDYSRNHAVGNPYYEAFVATLDAGVLDAATMDTEALLSFGESGRLLDLNAENCTHIREKYGNRFLYAKPYDESYSTLPVPVGIDISDSRLVREYGLYNGPCALGISASSQNMDAVERFLDYIFEG